LLLASIATNAMSSAAAPANDATIVWLPQPTSLPRSSANTSRNSPPVKVTRPALSTRGACGSFDSAT
jgi:hypothetical protein